MGTLVYAKREFLNRQKLSINEGGRNRRGPRFVSLDEFITS